MVKITQILPTTPDGRFPFKLFQPSISIPAHGGNPCGIRIWAFHNDSSCSFASLSVVSLLLSHNWTRRRSIAKPMRGLELCVPNGFLTSSRQLHLTGWRGRKCSATVCGLTNDPKGRDQGERRVVLGKLRRRQRPSNSPTHRLECRASWFDFSSESSMKAGTGMTTGDFTVLSHLKELGCGELLRRPREIHFSGCINESYAFHCTGGDFFVKINRAFDMDSMFVGESEALKRIEETKTVVAPSPLGCGNLPDGGSYIIMKHLRFRPFGMMQDNSQSALGQDLARLHQAECGDLFGFPMMTRVGIVPLDNRWSSSWSEFFIEQRLRDRFQRVYSRLGEEKAGLEVKGTMVIEKAHALLEDHNPKPSILHGDLWMGNSGLVSTGEVAIFDPACYIGDAEFDLAFEGWKPVPDFPGFSAAFYTAYHQVLPQASGFEHRHQIYQLFHLLNHSVIYGGEYYSHVMNMVDRILE